MLTFDVETTGLIPNGANWETDYDRFPYIVQIAWINDKEHCYIIKPDGWMIPEKVADIHSINQERAMKEGRDGKEILTEFLEAAKKAEKLVGHNIYFDISIIKANLLRFGIDKEEIVNALHKDKRFCTMQKSRKIFGKWPKLTELYRHFFGIEFEDAHSALGDARATKKCYEELINI